MAPGSTWFLNTMIIIMGFPLPLPEPAVPLHLLSVWDMPVHFWFQHKWLLVETVWTQDAGNRDTWLLLSLPQNPSSLELAVFDLLVPLPVLEHVRLREIPGLKDSVLVCCLFIDFRCDLELGMVWGRGGGTELKPACQAQQKKRPRPKGNIQNIP